MAFTVKDWKDYPDTSTPLTAAALEDLETRVSAYTDTVGAGHQPLDSDLTAIAALTTTSFGRSLLALADAAAGRTALGLGSAATSATGDFDASGAAAAAQAASQPLDSDLTAIAALTTTSYGRAFLALADAAAARSALSLGSAATSATTDFDAAGAAAAAQVASQPLDSDLSAIAALTTTSYGRAFLALADAAAGRTALGLGTAATHATGDYDAAGAAAAVQGLPLGLTGATQATRYVGATTSGAPVSGTFAIGDFVIDRTNGYLWICTTAGTPGTWTRVGGGTELGYAENTAGHITASLAANNYEDVTSLSITFTAGTRPVLLEAGGYAWAAGTANVRLSLLITDGSNVVNARAQYNSAPTTVISGPYARRRLSGLTAGNSYTYKVRLGNATGGTTGTSTLFAASDAPAYIQATEL